MLETLKDIAIEIQSFTLELLIFGFAFFIIEKIRPAHKKIKFFKPDFKQELALSYINVILSSPISYVIVAGTLLPLVQAWIPYQIFDEQLSNMPLALQILAACFIKDFATYWRHRVTHTVKWLWPFHSVHHAAKNLTWITGLRLHPVDIFVASLFDILILHILGFSGTGIIMSVFIIKAYNYFLHANLDLQYPSPIRYIFASPNFHRWHHATEKSAYNKNYCSVFSLLDWIFGTYYHPEKLPKDYGLEPSEQISYPNKISGWLTYPFSKLAPKVSKIK